MRSYQPTISLFAVALLFALFIVVALVSYYNVYGSFRRVLAEIETTAAIRLEMRLFLDRETGLRGYAATGRRLFLEPFTRAQSSLVSATLDVDAQLRELGLSGAAQTQKRIEVLQNEWERTVASNLLADPNGPRALAWQLRGKALMDQTRRGVDSALDDVIGDRQRTVSRTQNFVLFLLIGATLMAAFLATAAIIIERERARVAAQFTAALQTLAHNDSLTSLANRAKLDDELRHILAEARRYSRKVAVLFVDLDGFKDVNDRHGHEAGDRVLREVAQRLTGSVRESDVVARLGGDEFAIVLPVIRAEAEAEVVAAKLIRAIDSPIDLGSGASASVSASVGISLFPEQAANAGELLHRADKAMYDAKRRGKNRFASASG